MSNNIMLKNLGSNRFSFVTESDWDSSNLQYLYTGQADIGTSTSDSEWKISRFDFSDGSITYADGNQNFDNIYDNRESLSYS